MDYKKAYEEALERAKQGLPIDEVFPELRESEDEKIRKQLINEVREQIENIPAPDCCDSDDLRRLTILQSWLAYLEKQKERKPAEWSDEEIRKILDDYDEGRDTYTSFIKRLKSLRPQPHWKPGEEQMAALNKVVNGEILLTTQHKSLESLYNDLKKL